MRFPFHLLQYTFQKKPLLVGGHAKEFYGIRKSGKDIDLIVDARDYEALAALYPDACVDLYGDLGIKVHGFEIWKTICLYDYATLLDGAIEQDEYFIISLEKLLFMTALGMHKEKYQSDLQLIVKKIFELKYKDFDDSKYTK